ncbi:hypothetical protein ACNJF9_21185, partial [Mycobacterium tuberculosis]
DPATFLRDDSVPAAPLPAPAAAEVPRAEASGEQQDDMSPPGSCTRLDEHPIVANATRGEILLLQSSDAEVYAPMLAQSARTTRRYAERHGLHYR